ncbi:MAG: hypothetical protein RL434_3118 [Pseudomonadota bacterium]|jgi:hypothetical protein
MGIAVNGASATAEVTVEMMTLCPRMPALDIAITVTIAVSVPVTFAVSVTPLDGPPWLCKKGTGWKDRAIAAAIPPIAA